MSAEAIVRLASLKDVARFHDHLQTLGLRIPCDPEIVTGSESPLRWPLQRGPFKIGNRIAVQPMEGWDATPDGAPSENTIRRWQRFGHSGGKLIWGGEGLRFPMKAARIPINFSPPRERRAASHICGMNYGASIF